MTGAAAADADAAADVRMAIAATDFADGQEVSFAAAGVADDVDSYPVSGSGSRQEDHLLKQ